MNRITYTGGMQHNLKLGMDVIKAHLLAVFFGAFNHQYQLSFQGIAIAETGGQFGQAAAMQGFMQLGQFAGDHTMSVAIQLSHHL